MADTDLGALVTSGAGVAENLVEEGFATAQRYASTAFNEAVGFLNDLTSAAAQLQTIPPVDGTLGPVGDAIDAFVTPPVPATPTDLTITLPAVPPDPNLIPVTVPSFGNAPQFTAQPPVLDLDTPEPQPLQAVVPVAPSLPTVAVPDAPDIVLPDVPSLIGITVPTTPLLNLPTFTAILPDSPLAPDFIFAFNEPTFTSQLLTDLQSVLDTWVNGVSTGLTPEVENAIWDRERVRENALVARKMKESIRTYATKGFTKPPGALSNDIQDALQSSQDTLIGLSRDIMIKQADLEQSNRRFAFDQAWKVESGLIEYQNNIAQRAFDVAKYAQQVGIDIYREEVQAFTAQIQAYTAQVEAFKAALTAELAKLDIYRAELDGQKLIGELNLQSVQIYTAEVNAAKAVIEIFQAEVEAANVKATINKTIIDSFASQVGAYAEQVRAKAAEYQGYATLIQAQVAKADVYKTEADVYTSQVTGFRALVDAVVAQTNLQIKVGQDVPLDLFKARTEVYRSLVSAETDRVQTVAKVFDSETQNYSAQVSAEASKISSQVAVLRADTDLATAEGNLRIEAAKANVQTLIQQVTLLVEAIRGGSQVSAQLAAAALSSVNLSSQVGAHWNGSLSESASTSDSSSSSTSTVTSTSDSTSNNQSQSTINSTGTNTNFNYSN